MAAVKTRRKALTTAEKIAYRAAKSARIAEVSEQLKAFAASTDEALQAEYVARFGYYSARNAMLIVMQAPEATVVRAYGAWQAEGRQVRKGEHSYISILAPAGSSGGKAEQVDAQPGDVSASKERQYFRLVPVFDISQTEPIDTTPAHDHRTCPPALHTLTGECEDDGDPIYFCAATNTYEHA